MPLGGVIRTCWSQEGTWLIAGIATKSLFSLFGCLPVWSLHQRLFVSSQYLKEIQFLLARNLGCVDTCVCVCHRHVCRWFTLNLALNTLLIQKQLFCTGKMAKATYSILISSLQRCYVKKKVKEALSFFFSMPLNAFPSIFALHFSPLQHLHTLRCFQSLPRGAEQLTPLLPAVLYYSALLFRLLWW